MIRSKRFIFAAAFFAFIALPSIPVSAGLREAPEEDVRDPSFRPNSNQPEEQAASDSLMDESLQSPEMQELMKAKEAMDNQNKSDEKAKAAAKAKGHNSVSRRAEAFIAGPDWEFDGFISGGQDMQVKSVFTTNDLVYLNVGKDQGLAAGDILGIYRRGDRVRDPQTGKFLGYEVQKVADGEVTNRIENRTCSVRVSNVFQAVLIGDLVRKE